MIPLWKRMFRCVVWLPDERRILSAPAFATSLWAGPRDLHTVVGVDGGAPDLADFFNEA